jgi:hypothetical protein
VLLVELLPGQTTLPLGFTMPASAHALLAADRAVYLENADHESIRVSRLVDFPDTVPEPRPDVPANVRPSNPYGIVGTQARLHVNDASRNLIWDIDTQARTASLLVSFAPVANPLAPVGPPMVDAVPASIRGYGDSLLVSYLTGFPFGPGAASVQLVDRHAGTNRTLIGGLQTAVDTWPSAGGEIYVLEYSRSFTTGGPGRLLRFDTPSSPPIVIADTLSSPAALARDPRSGDMWVAEIFAGRIVRVLTPR